MNEWFKKRTQTVKDKWGKWTPLQKGILIGIIVLIVIAIVMMMKFSARPATVRLFNSPVNDEVLRSQIVTRLDNDNVRSYVSQDGYISVDDEKTAKRYRSILVSEGLEPAAKDPYSLFNTQRWSQSDFQNKVEWQEAQERLLEGHLKQLDFVSRANVRLVLPDDKLFTEEQAPTTASVVLFAKSGAELRPHVKGIQHLIARSVEGLKDDCEYITIIDGATGEEINDTKYYKFYDNTANAWNWFYPGATYDNTFAGYKTDVSATYGARANHNDAQIGAGGMNTVRGFENSISADKGIIGNVEIYTPEFAPHSRFVAFYDYGNLSNNRQGANFSSESLASVGIGYRYNNPKGGITVSVDYAHPVDDVSSRISNTENHRRWNAMVSMSF